MTTVEKMLVRTVSERIKKHTVGEVIRTLSEMDVLDFKRCMAAVANEHVSALIKQGMGKVDAMYEAAEKFCVSYECVRNYVYQHKKQM